MNSDPFFVDQDLQLIEALVYIPDLEPAYEHIKGCLVWADERPDGLSSAGYENLSDLWVARSFIHRGVPFSAWELDPEYFRSVWDRATKHGFLWPGFNRLTLNPEDAAYYKKMLSEAHEI